MESKKNKNVNNKNDVKKVYKDFLSGILQHIPEFLVVLKEDVEKNYGGDWDKAMKDEKMPEEYKDLEEGFKAFAKNMESLELDSEYAEKMEKIRLDFNQDDEKELINFTINELSKTGQAIANNPDALESLNNIITKELGGNALTKNEILEGVSYLKETYSGLTCQEIFEREEVQGLMMVIALMMNESDM